MSRDVTCYDPLAEHGEIRIYVPASPVPQPRARTTSINGKPRMYEAKKEHAIHTFKSTCRLAARQAYSGAPLEGPLEVTMLFVFPRPARLRWKSKPMPREPHTLDRGDVDNLIKATLDALNGQTFRDDAQVYRVAAEKWIAAGDEQPHVQIVIRPVNGERVSEC